MPEPREIPFGELLPDQPTYKKPGLVRADGCYPVPGGYGPFAGLSLSSDVLTTDAVRGAARFFSSAGAFVYVAGTIGGDLIVSRLGTSVTTTIGPLGAGEAWRFAQFNDFCITVAPGKPPQYLDSLATDTTWSELPGSPPTASVVGRLGDFLVFGGLDSNPSRVQWSAFNDPTAPYVVDALRQSGGFNFPQEFGAVTAIVAEPFPVVFQERAVWSFNPSGGASVFQRIPAARQIGAIAPGSVVSRGQEIVFLSRDGFYSTDGNGISPVGSSRVNRTFLSEVDQARVKETHGVVDWANECFVWAYPTTSATGFDRLLVLSYAQNRWSTASVDVGYLTEAAITGVTPADLDTQFGDLDNVPFLSDDPIFKTRGDVLGAWVDNGGDATFATFTSANLEANFETGEFQPRVGRRAFVDGLRLLAENTSQNETCAVTQRSPTPGAGRTFTPYSAAELDGFCPQLVEAAFLGAACRIPAGAAWDKVQGVQVRYEDAGTT